jgi:hypothetical protein
VPDHVQLLFSPPYSPELQPAEHRLDTGPLTDATLVNRHCAVRDDLEEVQAAHCVALQPQHERIRSTTLFSWWPRQIKQRRGPRVT